MAVGDEKEGLRQSGGEESSGNETAAGCENSGGGKHGNGAEAVCESGGGKHGNEAMAEAVCGNSGGEKHRNEAVPGCENSREEECGDGQESEGWEKGRRKQGRMAAGFILVVITIILTLLCFRSCSAGDVPLPEDAGRIYEEDCRPGLEGGGPGAEGGRLNIAVAQDYRISDEEPYFYIGFPEENAYDVVFAMLGADGEEIYRTDYVKPGTRVAVDGTAFLAKGEQKVDCLVSVYDRDSGALVSGCTTVVLNISYK